MIRSPMKGPKENPRIALGCPIRPFVVSHCAFGFTSVASTSTSSPWTGQEDPAQGQSLRFWYWC